MKILHSADWHLDAPLSGRSDAEAQFLRQELRKVPAKVAECAKRENCQLMLLAGDLFDGAYTKESYRAVYESLEAVKIPVFITPGNHDFCQPSSPYIAESWPENVHIFTKPALEAVYLESLDCTVYGAGYEAMDCGALLEGFKADGAGKWQIGILHGEVASSSPYCPVSTQQVRLSGLDYLALGHIHKGGSFRSGDALCAWPGCPMGHGYDEAGIKGVLVLTFKEQIDMEFLPLDTPRFFDDTVDVGENAADALVDFLPAVENNDFYRVTLTGYADGIDLAQLEKQFSHLPHLVLRDKTMPEQELWSAVGEDNLVGMYFGLLKDGLDTDSEKLQRCLKLAARISKQILDGQEVTLP